jgi:hypothetical protein
MPPSGFAERYSLLNLGFIEYQPPQFVIQVDIVVPGHEGNQDRENPLH